MNFVKETCGCALILAAALLTSLGTARAQVPPSSICPVASNVVFRMAPPDLSVPINSGSVTAFAVRTHNPQTWDFYPDSVQINGSSIAINAHSVFVLIPGIFPLQFFPIGQLAAGTYSVTINPVVTSVTPNFNCPPVTVPLVVVQAFENVPVPVTSGAWAALLAILAGLLGLTWMSRRRVGR